MIDLSIKVIELTFKIANSTNRNNQINESS
jgi:hypothetical protein